LTELEAKNTVAPFSGHGVYNCLPIFLIRISSYVGFIGSVVLDSSLGSCAAKWACLYRF